MSLQDSFYRQVSKVLAAGGRKPLSRVYPPAQMEELRRLGWFGSKFWSVLQMSRRSEPGQCFLSI